VTATYELDLTGIAHGGEALGRHAGKMVFVPYALPGERVRVEIVAEKERWARARLLEVLRASPDRIAAPCPYFGADGCGGCQWQHIAYLRQAALKQEIVADQLQRLGHLSNPPVADVIVLAAPTMVEGESEVLEYGYRNLVQFAVTPDGRLGFREAGGQAILPVDRCLLLHERLDALHASLDLAWPEMTGLALRAAINTDDAMILLETGTGEEPELEIDVPAACVLMTAGGVKPLIGEPWIEEQVAGRRYRVSADSRFPDNTVGAEALVALVAGYAEQAAASVLLDLYAGVGLFSVALSEQAGEIIAVEASPSACEDFAANAAGAANVSLHEGAAESVMAALREQEQHVDLAVMSPPRSGAGEQTLRELSALAPGRIIYLASDPAALARDGVHLAAAGYRLLEAQPLDLHPQTYRVETVAVWEKRE
jgi:23S rRNA (uracil1939-C5)-methyltransferase